VIDLTELVDKLIRASVDNRYESVGTTVDMLLCKEKYSI
jgi:hypothetical protein